MHQIKSRIPLLLLYFLGLFLLLEWLSSLDVITRTGHFNWLCLFAVFSFLISCLGLSLWISLPLNFIAMLFVLHKIFFYHTTYFQKLWAIYFVSDLEKNISFIIHGNWVGLTELFKVFVLLILLWIFGLFFPYLLTSKRMAVFLGFTIVYLSLLDIFTSYDEGEPMFWSIFIGLLFIGVLRVYHTRKRIG